MAFVDDEPALAMLAGRALPLYGCDPVPFTDPRAALRAITADPTGFDALITDHAMPGLSGLELVGEVRTIHPALPVVLTSGYLTPENHREARRVGVNAILAKPCTIEQLAAAALELVGGARPPL